MKIRIFCGAFIACLVCVGSVFAQTEDSFAKANQEYAAGHFFEAIDLYNNLVREGTSAALFYNLGNAYYRADDFGHAILSYERALALEPHQPEAEANLQLVRDKARALELKRDQLARLTSQFTLTQYAIAVAASFWVAAFALLALCFARRRSPALAGLLILSLLVLACAGVGLYSTEMGANGRMLAIVTAKNTDARLATADSAGTVLTLPAGSQIKILSTRGNWIYAALPNDLRGWIPTANAERVPALIRARRNAGLRSNELSTS